jgi:hypothetical protein
MYDEIRIEETMNEQNNGRIRKAILFVVGVRQFLVICGLSTKMKRLLILALLPALAIAANAQQMTDVRTFGTHATFSSTTATTTRGQPTVSLNDLQSFRNGEYTTIFHAGPPCRLSTPGAPTVMPSVNAGGLETISAGAGSSGFAYEIVAADKFGCYTAASVAGSTSAGNTLGQQTISITSGTRSNNLQTVTTSKAHGLVAGQMVYIRYFSTSDASFEGTWIVYTVPDPTHFTFLSSLDTRAGASTSFAGGTLISFNVNKISWTAVKGAWKYYIYGRTGGMFTRLGQTLFPYWVDYGSPMNDNQTFPVWIPISAPSSGANDHLTTQIVSGGGTKTLTLAASAGASVSGTTIKSDDGPALKAAASEINGGAVYIPPSGIIINSFTQLNKSFFSYNLRMAGDITLNDTLEFLGSVSATGTNNPPRGAFGWLGGSSFVGTAYPLVTTDSGPNHFYNVIFNCTALNGCLDFAAVVNDSNINDTFEYVYWSSGAGQTSDCVGQNAIFATGGFSFRFKFNTFATSPCGPNSESSVGLSPIPSVVFTPRLDDNTPTGNFVVESSWFLNRGAFDLDGGTSPYGVPYGRMSDIQTQNSLMPILQFTGLYGARSEGDFAIHGVTPADYPSAMVGNYMQQAVIGINVSEITGLQGGHNFFTGNPFAGVVGNNIQSILGISRDVTISGSATSYIVDGVFNSEPTGASAGGGNIGFQSLNVLTSIGNPYKLFVNGARPPAATCAVSSGGKIAPGTYSFAVAPVWWDNSVGSFGPFLNNCTTISGNQTVTIHWTAIPGVKGYYLAVGGANGLNATGPLSPINACQASGAYQYATSTSFVWTGSNSYNCGGSIPQAPGGGPTMMNASGFSAPQLLLTPVLFINLGTPVNFTIEMCADCTISNPCAGGGTGALAKRLNNRWVCN